MNDKARASAVDAKAGELVVVLRRKDYGAMSALSSQKSRDISCLHSGLWLFWPKDGVYAYFQGLPRTAEQLARVWAGNLQTIERLDARMKKLEQSAAADGNGGDRGKNIGDSA